MQTPIRTRRVQRVVDVVIQDSDEFPRLVRLSRTVNVSSSGLLMEVPQNFDAVQGEEVVVRLTWPGGTFESPGEIVRFDSPYQGDPNRSVMGIHLSHELPAVLLHGRGPAPVTDAG